MKSVYFERSMPRVLTTLALKRLTKRAIFAPSSPVRADDLDPLTLPGEAWVKLANRMCGICGSDLHLVHVDIDPMVHPAALPGYDRIYLGHEVVSEVEEAGSEVTGLEIGSRVIMKSRFLGATCHSQQLEPVCVHCEAGNYGLCVNQSAGVGARDVGVGWSEGYTAHQSEVWPVPDSLSDLEAAMVEPLACGVRAVLRHPPAPGGSALVLGSGTIGLGTIQALATIAPDANLYATARYPHQQAEARRYGATILEGELFEAASSVTGAKRYVGDFGNTTMLGGFDVVYDCVGSETTVEQSLRLARAGGAVVMVGISLHKLKVDLTPTWHQEVTLLGSMAHGQESWQGESVSTFELTARWLSAGKLSADGLVTHVFALDDWKEALRTAVDKRSGSIKVVFDFR